MGAHAAWWAERPRRWSISGLGFRFLGWLARLVTRPRRLLVVADFEPSADQLRRRFGSLPGFLALPWHPASELTGVQTGTVATGVNPIDLGELGPKARAAGVTTIAFWLPWDHVRGQTLLQCRRQGFRSTWLQVGGGGLLLPTLLFAVWRAWTVWLQQRFRLSGRAWTSARAAPCLAALPAPPTAASTPRPTPTIGHFMRTWTFGGVERQVALLAGLQHEAGQQPRILLQTAPPGLTSGGLPFLAAQIAARPIAVQTAPDLAALWHARGLGQFPWESLPADLRLMVLDLAGELLLHPVDVLHCWIDEANVVGWLAGRLAGVPAIVMTVLGVSPAHWPLGDRPWLRACYQHALRDPASRLVTISDAGRADYAEWLGADVGDMEVIRIGFPLPPRPSPEQVAAFRQEHGLADGAPTVIGVFRFDPEKRPLLFLDVIERVRQRLPEVRVLLAGHGSLAAEVQKRIGALGLDRAVTLLGQPADVLLPMAASDVLLMVSQVEGTPNVALEAQAMEAVPVLTDVGGCRETMQPGSTGLVCPRDDVDGLAQCVVRLLTKPEQRQAMAKAGRAHVAAAFAPERMRKSFGELYCRLADRAAGS